MKYSREHSMPEKLETYFAQELTRIKSASWLAVKWIYARAPTKKSKKDEIDVRSKSGAAWRNNI